MATKKRERAAPGIYKLGPALYELAVSTGKGPDGKYGQAFRRFKGTLRAAKTERARMLSEVADGTLVPPSESITMAELHQRFMARKTISPATRDQYDYLWKLVEPFIGATAVRKLRADEIELALTTIVKRGLSPNTVRKSHKHITALLNRAIAWHLIGHNVAKDAERPAAVPYNVTPPTSDQRVTLVDAAFEQERQFGALVYLAIVTGARRGELGGLRWCDIDLKNATVRILHQPNDDGTLRPTKTKHQRIIDIDEDTVKMLDEHLAYCEEIAAKCEAGIKPECFVFSPMPGNTEPYRLDGLTWRFGKLATATGVNNRLHDMRHAQATTLLDDGISPVVVAGRLGMSVAVLHETYGHSDTVQEKRAAVAGGLRR